jgi:hypothetical protein
MVIGNCGRVGESMSRDCLGDFCNRRGTPLHYDCFTGIYLLPIREEHAPQDQERSEELHARLQDGNPTDRESA